MLPTPDAIDNRQPTSCCILAFAGLAWSCAGLGWPGLAKPIICDIVSKLGRPTARSTKKSQIFASPDLGPTNIQIFWHTRTILDILRKGVPAHSKLPVISTPFSAPFSAYFYQMKMSRKTRQDGAKGPRHTPLYATAHPLSGTLCSAQRFVFSRIQRRHCVALAPEETMGISGALCDE